MKVHIFDVDHTIVRCSTVQEFIFEGLKQGVIPLSIGFWAVYFFFLYNVTGTTADRLGRSYPFFRNLTVERIESLAASTFRTRIGPKLDAAVAERLASIQKDHGRVIIASSSFDFILKPLASLLGIEEMVVSKLELREGVTTGRMSGKPAYRSDKKDRVLEYLEQRRIRPEDCAFYSDSIHDLPLLRTVGQPVAVNPDQRLRRVALAEGWEIVST
ncbi:MAG TPA: HAD family phosphatase [Rectinemataceae bacterium]|nr:HAD family phosphatase [Rectinemataceae bacterium]